jgi:hypothetical protein
MVLGSSGRDSLEPTYDRSEWPLFVVRMPAVRLSAEAFDRHLQACGEPFRQQQPFVMMVVMGEHPPLPATQRKAVGDAMKSDDQRNPGLQRGLGIVVRTSFERGIVTAINWVARSPFPFAAFTSESSARTWLLQQLPRRDSSLRRAAP